MKTLVIGSENESLRTLTEALELRRHQITTVCPESATAEEVVRSRYELVVFSDITDHSLRLGRLIRAADLPDSLTLIAVLEGDSVSRFNEVLEAGFDQCIVESLYDARRLDIRLAFAEKMSQDKIQRSIVEEQLRESEARYRSIVETTVDAIITINERGLIRTFNKAAEKLFQYKESEVFGKNVNILMPEPYRQEHDDYINNYLNGGSRKIIGHGREVSGMKRDGTTFPLYLAVSEVHLRDQRFFTGIVRDISEQRRLEQEILRTSEYERRRIGQDLHDGLGQMLTGIGLISKQVARQLEQEKHALAEQAHEITRLIRESDQYARELARGLVPVDMDSEGLATGLERLAVHAEKLFRIDCTFRSDGRIEFEDATQVTHLYRIAQEAVNNAVKHGEATEVEIRLVGTRSQGRLQVDDNGTGFAPDWDEKGGLGVRIMQFRASLIDATLEISDSEMGGASITCSFPIEERLLHHQPQE